MFIPSVKTKTILLINSYII